MCPAGSGPPAPRLVLVTGLQGTGKSTVADAIGDRLGAAVFGWDWSMAALTPFAPVQDALRSMDAATYRSVGWALLGHAARSQLRRGMSVVLDGMARDDEIAGIRALGRELRVSTIVILITCDDRSVQRARIEGRTRGIPGWDELTWEDVERGRSRWVSPVDVDLVVDGTRPLADTLATVGARLDH